MEFPVEFALYMVPGYLMYKFHIKFLASKAQLRHDERHLTGLGMLLRPVILSAFWAGIIMFSVHAYNS